MTGLMRVSRATYEETRRNAALDAAIGAGIGLVFAKYAGKSYTSRALLGAALGAACGALIRGQATTTGRVMTGWAPPPHPIEVIASFDPAAPRTAQVHAVLIDYYRDNDLRSWVDDGAVRQAFNVKKKEDYDPLALIAAYENKSDPV